MKKRCILLVLIVALVFIASAAADSDSRAIKIWTSEEAGSHAFYVSSIDIAITDVTFQTSVSLENAKMIVELLKTRPSTLKSIDNPYQYIAIGKFGIPDASIRNEKIRFRVTKEWIDNNSHFEGINAYAELGGWKKLKTEYLHEDDYYHYYETEPNIFSYFAIGGEPKPEAIETEETPQTDDEDAETNTTAAATPEKSENFIVDIFQENRKLFFYILIAVSSLLFLYAITALSRTVIRGGTYENPPELHDFIEEELSEGVSKKEIDEELETAGWPKRLIEKIVHGEHLPPEVEVKIKSYIQLMSRRNKTYDEIKDFLVQKGWDEEVIDNLIKDFTSA